MIKESPKSVPTAADWGDYERDMEIAYAYEKFGGKTIEEVLRDGFEWWVLGASEALSYMPEAPFQYYVLVFKAFLLDPERFEGSGGGDQDGPSTFLLLVRDTLARSPRYILPVMEELMPVAEYVAAHQADYGADEDIYGSFKDLLTEIKQRHAAALKADV